MKCMIYDYETLGTNQPTAPIVSMAITTFNTDRFLTDPYQFQEVFDSAKFYKFNVEEQVKDFGCKIEQDTLDWWSKQDKEVQRKQLSPSKDDCSITRLYDIISSQCDQYTLVFTRGNTFDPMITQFMLEKLDEELPYPHWMVRDTRSYIEGLSYGTGLKNGFTPPELEEVKVDKHDPRVDIALDILRIQALVKAIS